MPKHNRFIPRGKPRYRQSPEAALVREYSGFTPWKVDCVIYQSLLDPEGIQLSVFCRAPDPSKAMHAARILWGTRIKERNIRPGAAVPEFPKMDDRHEVMCLDDTDYLEIWKKAVAGDFPRVWFGEVANPLSFLFFPDKASSLIT